MIIKNGRVFTEEGTFVEKNLCIDGDKISSTESGEVIDATGLYVIPGLTDIHFHGCVGYDFCDGTPEALEKMAEYELSNGVTTICPASMTFSEEQLTQIFANAANYKSEKGATLVGINMEGPFISPQKVGAQNPAYVQPCRSNLFVSAECGLRFSKSTDSTSL
jgi:N-acetylglucosamine-6-phosphate deacetylase